MKLTYVRIQNFKSIRDIEITDIEQVLILVGKNNTGKTVILDALRALAGSYQITRDDFNREEKNIVISAKIQYDESDLHLMHEQGIVSNYKRFDLWEREFISRLPSYSDGTLTFDMIVNKDGMIRYYDGHKKHNPYIKQVLPVIYHIDNQRNFRQIQDEIAFKQDDKWMNCLRSDKCIFDVGRICNRCFRCIGMISKKSVDELNVCEAARLFEYKMYHQKLDNFLRSVNQNFQKNGGKGEEILYSMNFHPDEICRLNGELYNRERDSVTSLDRMSMGMRCIYILSLLEAYVYDTDVIPCIILMEDPELYLHPQMQKVAAEILFRLSKKNQVFFSTHAPSMLFNFTSKQIRQITLDKESYTVVEKHTNIDRILIDLGYTANDLMNVDFVFIVEGKQDKSRLPLLLNRYYSEVYDKEGKPFRVAIITTNSCTNIKTYANLKYINQVYLKDHFLMIRDGDGKDPEELAGSLCRYYDERNAQDADKLPKVKRENVLILKYYSFENYFLNPKIMVSLGLLQSEEQFYEILYDKWTEYLQRISSGKHFSEATGVSINGPDDIKEHIEEFKIYMRGHNLFDIFYGPYRDNERELLQRYIELAPRDDFKDILDAIDKFVYFENRRKDIDI